MNGQIKEAPNTQQVLQRKSVFLVWLFSALTFGIYAGIWYLKRKPEFDNLNTQKKLNKGLTITYLIFIIIYAIYNFVLMIMRDTLQSVLKGNIIISIIFIIFIIALIVMHLVLAFNTRTILNEAWALKGVTRKVSWIFTLIFSLFYLQYEINRTIDNRENEKRTGPWVCIIILIVLIMLVPLSIWIVWWRVSNTMETGMDQISQGLLNGTF